MEMNLKNIGESLELSVAKENLLEIIGDLSDYSFEKLLDLGEAIPVFSYLVRGLKTTFAVRDAIFLEKVITFLQNVGRISEKERSRMIEKIQCDERYKQKFGKFSIIALDRFDDEFKAKYLGIAAQYLAREEITFEFYQRFSHIIDSLTVADLQEITRPTFLNFGRNTFYAFEALGLIQVVLKLPNESDLKVSWRQNPNIIQVSHRRLTDWGEAVKNILLELPVDSEV